MATPNAKPLPKKEWFEAARSGHEEAIVELLAEWPELAMLRDDANDSKRFTALHHAAKEGHEQVVARLLAVCPGLINATADEQDKTALHFAAQEGHGRVVARLLAAASCWIAATTTNKETALHLAASGGHEEVVVQLLEASPDLITAPSNSSKTALSSAVKNGHDKIFTQLLAACPELLERDNTVLFYALSRRDESLAVKILTLCPNKNRFVDSCGWTPLMCAISHGQERIAEMILAVNPAAADDDQPLHIAVQHCSRDFVVKLWQMNPQALNHTCMGKTPFDRAIAAKREDLIELFQWSLSFDQLIQSFKQRCVYKARYGPLMDQQCVTLLECLNRDLTNIVFQYVGLLIPIKKPRPNKHPLVLRKHTGAGQKNTVNVHT